MKTKRLTILVLAAFLLVGAALLQTGCKTEEKKEAGGEQQQTSESESESESVGTVKPGQVGFKEYQIGEAKDVEGISVTPVYFQSVDMEPKELAPGSDKTDIHIEADVKAIKGNKTGFGIEEFVPYITVKYEVKDSNGTVIAQGAMMPMNATDGPHYGQNIKMPGAGDYKLKFVLESPEKQGYALHSDSETGVEGRFWKKPIELDWDFKYLPIN